VGNARNYDLLAIDLDGTLLDAEHHVPARNRAALHVAHEAGLKIVLCTGRSFTETRPILNEIGLDLDATVTVGGALLTEAATGRTFAITTIPPAIARDAANWLLARDYAVVWLRDADAVGFDGYVINHARLHPAIQRWFEMTPCAMRHRIDLPGDDEAPLRITVVDDIAVLDRISDEFSRVFDGRLTHNIIRVPTYGFTVLEAFESSVSKWSGIRKLCERWRVDPRRTVAVGDDVNDLSMIEHAGLGVAVANAKPAVLRAATRHVAANEACGVAELIEQLLSE
jgi:5-amino-6-(5-phospho-D-ribitylamino)uracil phosphatase